MVCLKKMCSAAAVLFFVTLVGQINAVAETYFASGDYKYTYRYDGTVAIAAYLGTASDLDIPAQINNSDVTEISWGAFKNFQSLKEVNFPDTLRTIGDSSFYGCASLKQVTVPESVSKIGANAFYGCTSLESVELKGSIQSIEKYSFNRCISLKKFYIPETVTAIGEYAFYGCISLEAVYIPSSVYYIEAHAFDLCDSLTIYGYEDSYAQAFAEEKGIEFISVGETEGVPAENNYLENGVHAYNKFENNNLWDLNRDGIVNYLDLQLMQKFITKIKDCFFGISYYDFNNDGKLNILDVSCFQIKLIR